MSYNDGSFDFNWGCAMQLVSPEKIAAVMGLTPVPHSIAELEAQVAGGLPKSALRNGVEQIALTAEARRALQARIIPEATYKRRRDRLTPDESEKTERLARVYATAAYVWDDPADARAFLATPHPLLEGRAPLEVALTELGARRVEELLWKLFYGLSA
jgi:putative toxin-antitoxin system antitoxin component (TIGR02293 family)